MPQVVSFSPVLADGAGTAEGVQPVVVKCVMLTTSVPYSVLSREGSKQLRLNCILTVNGS